MADGTIKLPALALLKRLISKSASAKADRDKINGDLGQAIAKAVEDSNLHASAFKLVNKLQKMDAVKLNAFLTHFDDYREKLELDKLAAVDLPGMAPMHEADKEAATKTAAGAEPGKMQDGPGTGGEKVGATTGTVQ